MRKNPLSNCDKRFKDLREAFDSNLSKLKQDLIENVGLACDAAQKELDEYPSLKAYTITPKMYKDFGLKRSSNKDLSSFCSLVQDKIERVRSESGLQKIVDAMRDNAIFSQFITPYFGMTNIRVIEKPFYFVHFTDRESSEDIMATKTFLGREDVVFSTQIGVQSDLVDTGYVFVYALSGSTYAKAMQGLKDLIETWVQKDRMLFNLLQEKDENGEYLIAERSEEEAEIFELRNLHRLEYPFKSIRDAYPYVMIIGKADKGIEFYHTSDRERQVLVPTECIQKKTLRTDELLYELFGQDDDSPTAVTISDFV